MSWFDIVVFIGGLIAVSFWIDHDSQAIASKALGRMGKGRELSMERPRANSEVAPGARRRIGNALPTSRGRGAVRSTLSNDAQARAYLHKAMKW